MSARNSTTMLHKTVSLQEQDSEDGLQRQRRPIPLKPLYTAADVENLVHTDSLPGQAPFVRGPYASMYTQKPWTIRQYTGYADAAGSNLAFRTALEQGAQGLSVAFDLPTQRGYDSDEPEALADVGMAGVAIDTVDDMARLFEGIALERVSVSMTMNGAVLPVLAAFIVAAEERGVPAGQLTGTIQNDILKEYMVRNTWIFAPEPSLRIVGDVAEFLAVHMPRFNALSVSGYHFQEAGADPVLELALTFANARKYVETLCSRGMSADEVCERLSFFFGVGADFFVEVAKLRAARLVWSHIAASCGARSAKACALRMHCQTSGWSLSARQPDNNVVRTTVEAMAAVFGGTQSLHTNAHDEALSLPSAPAARLARDTQLILQHEMGLCDVVDPWAGSYMMEALTADVAKRTHALLVDIEAQGGVLAAIRSGWVHRRIHQSATRTQAHIDAGERVVVGVNRFVSPDADAPAASLEIDGRRVQAQQARRIANAKAQRDCVTVSRALEKLTRAARDGTANLLALTIECIRARATMGECTRALEVVWPRYVMRHDTHHDVYGAERASDSAWRAACEEVNRVSVLIGRKLRVLIAKLGQDGHDRGANVVAAALSDAGFEVSLGDMFSSPSSTADLAVAQKPDVIGVSSLSGAHRELVSQLLGELADRGAGATVVVGGIVPDEHARWLRHRGVADVFGPGTPLETIVQRLAALVLQREHLNVTTPSPAPCDD
jgi:methylmalonyl-CoA mutase C-terminal domain/methylmalonyl-CoA mutase N-terminal domain